METKKCKKCSKEKNILDFYLLKKTGYRWGKCNDCHSEYLRRWRKKNPGLYEAIVNRNRIKCKDSIKESQKKYRIKYPERLKDRKLKLRYRISLLEYSEILKKQNAECAICHKKNKLFVDHDHSSGEVRGLLCNTCNLGLGYFYNDNSLLKSAIKYIIKDLKQN